MNSKTTLIMIFFICILISVPITYFYVTRGSRSLSMAKITGYSTICVKGVEYIQFPSGASVSYNSNGTIKTCK